MLCVTGYSKVAEQKWNLGAALAVLKEDTLEEPKETLKLSVPAILFVFQNAAMQLGI